MPTNFVLIDCENRPPKDLKPLDNKDFLVTLFLGPQQAKSYLARVIATHDQGTQTNYVLLKEGGPNALDFLIAYHLGQLQAKEPTARFYIITGDKGFQPLINHLKAAGVRIGQYDTITDIPAIKNALKKQLAATKKEQFEKAVIRLRNMKASPPAKLKTLRNTLHALFEKKLSVEQLQALVDALRQRGFIKIENTKVTYNLPAEFAPATAS